MTVSSKKIHPPPHYGSTSFSMSALTGSYKSKPASSSGDQDMIYRRAPGGVWIGVKRSLEGETLLRQAIERAGASGTSFSLPMRQHSGVVFHSSSSIQREEIKNAMADLEAEVLGLGKARPAFGIWADRKEDALEIEAELRREWA